MRILQLIDSLETGGAERMAVNYANALASRIEWSGIAVSRKQGSLGATVSPSVYYSFLQKKATLDLKAILKLRRICKQHNVDFIHAHSSSWFLAVCVKMLLPSVKVIWHDHYGLSEFLESRNVSGLAFASRFFFATIAVNGKLADWAKARLHCPKVAYLPNFASQETASAAAHKLRGTNGKRILCLANLRPQKDHAMLLEAFRACDRDGWTLHLVGKDFGDEYARDVKAKISELGLEDDVFAYGALDEVAGIIAQSNIGVLSSKSEGLPVSLLEYGFGRLPTIATAVGEVPRVINDGQNGLLCDAGDAQRFAAQLEMLMRDPALRETMGRALFETVNASYSEASVIKKYIGFLS